MDGGGRRTVCTGGRRLRLDDCQLKYGNHSY
jgi:hypothetical protein